MTLLKPGRCRHCQCSGDACTTRDGEKCVLDHRVWACNAPACERAEAARLADAERERKARATRPTSAFAELLRNGWGTGAAQQDEAAYAAMKARGLSGEAARRELKRRHEARRKRAHKQKGCAA